MNRLCAPWGAQGPRRPFAGQVCRSLLTCAKLKRLNGRRGRHDLLALRPARGVALRLRTIGAGHAGLRRGPEVVIDFGAGPFHCPVDPGIGLGQPVPVAESGEGVPPPGRSGHRPCLRPPRALSTAAAGGGAGFALIGPMASPRRSAVRSARGGWSPGRFHVPGGRDLLRPIALRGADTVLRMPGERPPAGWTRSPTGGTDPDPAPPAGGRC